MEKITKKQFIDDLSKLVSLKTFSSRTSENKKALDFIESKINNNAIVKRIKKISVD